MEKVSSGFGKQLLKEGLKRLDSTNTDWANGRDEYNKCVSALFAKIILVYCSFRITNSIVFIFLMEYAFFN